MSSWSPNNDCKEQNLQNLHISHVSFQEFLQKKVDKTFPKLASIFHEFPATPCLNGMSTSREGDGAWLETKRVARNLSKITTLLTPTLLLIAMDKLCQWGYHGQSPRVSTFILGDSLGSECHKHQSWQRALPWNVLQTVATMPVGWEVFVHAALHVNAILTVKMGIVALALRMVAKGAYLRSSIGNRGRETLHLTAPN